MQATLYNTNAPQCILKKRSRELIRLEQDRIRVYNNILIRATNNAFDLVAARARRAIKCSEEKIQRLKNNLK